MLANPPYHHANFIITHIGIRRLDVATPDIVLDELNQMKKEREADEKKLASLIKTKESISKASDMESNLKALCAKIAPNLDTCITEDKKNAFKYLDLNIKATPEGADIKGYLDPSVLMASQSSECLISSKPSSIKRLVHYIRPLGKWFHALEQMNHY